MLSLLAPTLRDQGYLKDNAYILPLMELAVTVLCLVLILTTKSALTVIHSLEHRCCFADERQRHNLIRRVKPTRIGIFASIGVFLVGLLSVQWCLTLAASVTHLAAANTTAPRHGLSTEQQEQAARDIEKHIVIEPLTKAKTPTPSVDT
jgi:hypothetical protein